MHSGVDNTPAFWIKLKLSVLNIQQFLALLGDSTMYLFLRKNQKLLREGKKLEEQIISEWSEGLLSEEEKYQKIIEIWTHTKKDLEKVLPNTLDKNGSAYDLFTSKARGNMSYFDLRWSE